MNPLKTNRPKKESSMFGKMIENLQSAEEKLAFLELIFDNIYNGAMITDANGYITHFNKPYGLFLDIEPDAPIGKHCTDVIENTRMHIVAETGKAEINQSQRIRGLNMVVQRIPIKENGNVIAVFGQVMFKDVKDVRNLAKKLSLLESKVKLYEEELITLRSTRYTFDSIIGKSNALMHLKREAMVASGNDFPVLITGESGTGKELFAQAIHHAGRRKIHPFVRINCAAIPKDLLESELFGYEKGAFTGARKAGKPGKFELAHRGTVFLDEIGDMPIEMQPKLLRVLEEKEFERIGGNKVFRSDFRLIAATNQDLEKLMKKNAFRKDLFYRLNVIPIHIPPLRERPKDILPLCRHFLSQMAHENSLQSISIARDAEFALIAHSWPGNTRELLNVVERALTSIDHDRITAEDIPFYIKRIKEIEQPFRRATLKDVMEKAETEAIKNALRFSGNNKAGAAKILGIHRTLLYKKMKKYNIALQPGQDQENE